MVVRECYAVKSIDKSPHRCDRILRKTTQNSGVGFLPRDAMLARICYGPVSVISRCSTKTAKHRITQITPHDSPGTLVF